MANILVKENSDSSEIGVFLDESNDKPNKLLMTVHRDGRVDYIQKCPELFEWLNGIAHGFLEYADGVSPLKKTAEVKFEIYEIKAIVECPYCERKQTTWTDSKVEYLEEEHTCEYCCKSFKVKEVD